MKAHIESLNTAENILDINIVNSIHFKANKPLNLLYDIIKIPTNSKKLKVTNLFKTIVVVSTIIRQPYIKYCSIHTYVFKQLELIPMKVF